MRFGIGEVALLPCRFYACISFSHVRISLIIGCVVRICGVARLDLEGDVDGFVFVDDHAVPIVECHGNRAIAVVVDVVDGCISAYGCAIVGCRHILRDIGAVCHIGEIDRINPLRQGVGDGIRSDFRGCGDGVVDLFERLRQIFRGRSVVFLAGDGVRVFGEVAHLLGVARSLHHVQGCVPTSVGCRQRGRIVVTVVIVIAVAVDVSVHVVRVGFPLVGRPPIIPIIVSQAVCLGLVFRTLRPTTQPLSLKASGIGCVSEGRIAVRQEDDILLRTGTSRRQIVRCFQGVFPVGSAIWPRIDGRADIARGNRELRSYLRPVAERHHGHLHLLLRWKSGIRVRQKLPGQFIGGIFRIPVTVFFIHTVGLVKHQHNVGRHRGRNRG